MLPIYVVNNFGQFNHLIHRALRDLDIEGTKTITAAGLEHLAELPALETLNLYVVNGGGDGLGDLGDRRPIAKQEGYFLFPRGQACRRRGSNRCANAKVKRIEEPRTQVVEMGIERRQGELLFFRE